MRNIAVFIIAALTGLGGAQAEPIALTFDEKSTFFINRVQEKDEPLIPSAEEKGPAFVATGRPFYDVKEDDVYDHGFTVAPGTQYQFGIQSACRKTDKGNHCQRDNSLRIALLGNDDTVEANVQDKAFMRLNRLDEEQVFLTAQGRSDTLNLSFDMKFDRFYEKPKRWTMHMQIYQPSCGPALSLQMVRQNAEAEGSSALDQPLEVSLIGLRDKRPGYEVPAPSPRHVTITNFEVLDMCPSIRVERDRWYQIALEAQPGAGTDADGNEFGQVTLRMNGEPVCEFKGNWGIRKSASGRACNPGSVVDIGVYRSRFRAFQAVYFDNVSLSFEGPQTGEGQ
ncbi:hypothetical protein [Salipiger bermudensis]|uniref:hypothetical protein n=1 Tax=Salipiger bermudensis TaxID=344736 RepID=UPI00300BA35B